MPPPTDVVIDTRPLWLILIHRSRQPLLLAVGIFLYWWVRNLGPGPDLSAQGQAALAVFTLCVFFWVFSVLPLMITGLLAIILIPLSGVMSPAHAYALFGNEAVFFILGAFILAAAMMKSGLSARIAVFILDRFRGTPHRLLVSILLLNAAMSFFMAQHAVAAMTFPIIIEIAAVLGIDPKRSSYGRALFIAMAWGSTIGGVGTLLGGARGPLALAILRESTGQSFSFAQWSLAVWPIVLLMLAIGYVIMTRFFPVDIDSADAAESTLHEKRLAMGRASYQERAIGLLMVATFLTWILRGQEFGLANIALGAVVVLFVFRLVSWRDIEEYVNWGVILMYGGAICLGSAVNQSGAAGWLAQHTVLAWAVDGRSAVLILSLLAILLTEAVSNSAVVALLMPVSLGVAHEFGMDPRIMTLVVAVPAGLAFTLPVGTPANAIAFSSGYFRLRDMIFPGALLASSAWLVFNLVANWYWPLLGLSIQSGAVH